MRSVIVALGVLSFLACGGPAVEDDDPTTSAGTGGVDDRYYPPPNGVQISETAACSAFEGALEAAIVALPGGCVMTKSTCPSLIRVIPGHEPDCVMYDEGSVAGCVDFFRAITSCDELKASLKQCVATVYPGTEPAGCP